MAVDTLKQYERLCKAGLPEAAAKAIVEALKEARDERDLALTKKRDVDFTAETLQK